MMLVCNFQDIGPGVLIRLVRFIDTIRGFHEVSLSTIKLYLICAQVIES